MTWAGAHSECPADVVILVAGLLVRLRRTVRHRSDFPVILRSVLLYEPLAAAATQPRLPSIAIVADVCVGLAALAAQAAE